MAPLSSQLESSALVSTNERVPWSSWDTCCCSGFVVDDRGKDDLKNRKHLCQEKCPLMENVRQFKEKWFADENISCGIKIPAVQDDRALRRAAMDATEEDLQNIPDQQGRTLPLKTAFSLDTCVSDGLQYVHSYEYTNPGVNTSSLRHGFSKNNESETYLIDAANFRVPTSQTKRKKSKEDLRKAHDGATEFATWEGHTGARKQRVAGGLLGGDLKNLEGDLKNRKYICPWTDDFLHLMNKCVPHGNNSCGFRVPAARDYHAYSRPTTPPTVNRIVVEAIWASCSKPAPIIHVSKDVM
ncbi:hypothetical protein MRX96_017032 [Rhipicephalus microplus]